MGRTPQNFHYPGCSIGSVEWKSDQVTGLVLGLTRAFVIAFIIVRLGVEWTVGLCPNGAIADCCLWAGPWRRLRRLGGWPLLQQPAQGYASLAAGAHQHVVLPFRPLSLGLRTQVVVPLA